MISKENKHCLKDLLSKEHYCHKIHASFTKNRASSFHGQPTYPPMWITPLPPFLKENLDSLFQKSEPSINL